MECPLCKGFGRVERDADTLCPKCGGEGTLCDKCREKATDFVHEGRCYCLECGNSKRGYK